MTDTLLDRFMPEYDVAKRHSIRVAAPAEVAFAVAREMDVRKSAVVRVLFRLRELILRTRRGSERPQMGLMDWTRSLGWGLLAELPGREIVMGAITQPWSANVVFRPVSREQFAAYCEPDHVKIVWNLLAEPAGAGACVFRTETRVHACDEQAPTKFRRYWKLFSPGIFLIRLVLLRLLKKEAEARVRAQRYAAA